MVALLYIGYSITKNKFISRHNLPKIKRHIVAQSKHFGENMGRIRSDYSVYPKKHVVQGSEIVVWWVWWWSGDDRYQRSLEIKGHKYRPKAERKAHELFLRGDIGGEVARPSPTLEFYCAEFFPRLKTSITALYRKQQQRRLELHVIPALGKYKLTGLTVPILEAWAESLKGASAAIVVVALSTVLDEAVRLGDLDENKLKRIKWTPPAEQTRGVLTLAEGLDILNHPERFDTPQSHLLNLTAALSGARDSELMALKPENITDGEIHIKALVRAGEDGFTDDMTKTGASGIRSAGVPKWLIDQLLAASGKSWVFESPRIRGQALSLGKGGKWLKEAFSLAGIDYTARNITFHSWRHWAASTLSGAGVSNTAIDLNLGHVIKGTLGDYLHQTAAHVQEVRDGWERVMHSPPVACPAVP